MHAPHCRVRPLLPLVLLLPLSLAGTARAATTRNVPAQYATIQAAVNAAVSGDTVLVADGTYSGTGNRDIDTLGKNITVKSVNGASKATIDCGGSYTGDGSGSHRGFYIHSGETVTLSGLTIENGYTDYNLPTPAKGRGGGVYMQGGHVTLQNCTITNCASTGFYSDEEFGYNEGEGGAICNETYSDDGSVPAATLTLTNCTLSGNSVSAAGGGIFNGGGTLSLTGCTVSDNGNGGDGSSGGGVYCGPQCVATLQNCQITGNNCTDGGGGLQNYGSATLTDCTVTGNSIPYQNNTAGTPNGGGIQSIGYVRYDGVEFDAALTLTNCTISSNQTSNGSGGGVANEEYSTATLTNCTLDSNNGGNGGGVWNISTSGITLTRCKVLQNTAQSGGGLYNGGSATLINCTVFGNTVSDGAGGGQFNGGGFFNNAPSGSALTVINCTVTANRATGSGGGLYNYGGATTFTNDILYGDSGGEIAGGSTAPTVTYSDVQGSFTGSHNIDADPLFTRNVNLFATPPDFGDFRLQPTSPCLGAGNHAVAPATDKAGVVRPNPPSIGAFEAYAVVKSLSFAPTRVVGGSVNTTGTVTLLNPAPSGGAVVSLSSNNVAITFAASTVTVPAGATSATFRAYSHKVTSMAFVRVTAGLNGTSTTASVTVLSPATTLASLSFSPASVTGGTQNTTGTVTLTAPAPSGGAIVSLGSSSGAITFAASTVTIAAGATTATFRAYSHKVTSTVNVTVTATYSGVSKTATITVTPPAPAVTLTGISFSPATVKGGSVNTTGTVTLSAPAAAATIVALASNSSAITFPASTVTVAAGATSATFRAYSHTVTSTKTVTVTATLNSVSKTANITVTP